MNEEFPDLRVASAPEKAILIFGREQIWSRT